jgi:hypothetical protein
MDVLAEIPLCPEDIEPFKNWTNKRVIPIIAMAYLGFGTSASSLGAQSALDRYLNIPRVWRSCTDRSMLQLPSTRFVMDTINYIKRAAEYFQELKLTKGEIMKRYLRNEMP